MAAAASLRGRATETERPDIPEMPREKHPLSIQLLETHRLAANAPRVALMEILLASPARHLTAEQLCAAMLKRNDGQSISSFKKAIYDLADQGPLARVVVPDRKNRSIAFYELADQLVHRHLYCTHCGSLTEVFDAALEQHVRQNFLAHGLVPAKVDLALPGLCATCQAALATPVRPTDRPCRLDHRPGPAPSAPVNG
jgi:Fe2+ or Zn2+ uptake regulation protein